MDEQNKSRLPLSDPRASSQGWDSDGIVSRLKAKFNGDFRAADKAVRRTAQRAMPQNPLGFLHQGLETYIGYWRGVRHLAGALVWENGPIVKAKRTGT